MKSGNLKFLEPSGHLQACNGTDLPLLTFYAILLFIFIVYFLWKLSVFENMVLRRIFGLRRDEVTGEWRRLHNEELNDLYSSPNIAWVIKSRRMR